MLQKPSSCSGCPLENANGGFSLPEGAGKNGVLVLGEALGDREKFDGLPLRPYAEAGSTFQTAIRLLGIERENFIIYNVVNCQPPYNALENTLYEYEAVEHCKVHVRQVIAKYKPKVILALGNVPLKHLNVLTSEVKSYIEELQSTDSKKAKAYLKKFKISSLRGYILPTIYNIPMIASLHPSFITREGRIYIGVLMRDIKTAVQLAQGLIPKFKSNYKEKPSVVEVESFFRECKANPNLVISHDIETPETTIQTDESEIEYENVEVRNIDSIQFSFKEGTGIFVPWYGDYVDIIKKILALPNVKTGWNNWAFDKINIEYHLGKGAINGLNIDSMWFWKWLNQDFVSMGRSLQFATNFFAPEFPAWKHQAQLDPEKYGILDVDATLRIFNGLKTDLSSKRLFSETKSLYEGFIDDVVKIKPILDWTSENGFPIDPIERERFKKQIVEERTKTLNDLQDLYPTELRKVTPTEGYKFVPKEVVEVEELFRKASSVKNDGLFYIVESDELYNKRLAQYLEEHTRHEETTGLVLKEFQIDSVAERRWCRMEEFKPSSSKQVLDYIKLRKYKVPKKKERGIEDKETTGKDEIYHLWEETSDPLFEKVIYYRELDKMLKTYVGTGKTGWRTGHDGRIHTSFTFLPATGQLSSRNPNIQNAPARGTKFSSSGYRELATQFRKTIAASSGKMLLAADWSAFHALTLAFEAEDEEYMRVVKLDPHSFVAAHILSGDIPLRLVKLKRNKPDNLSTEDWKKQIANDEETLERFKTLHNWLSLSDDKLKEHLEFIKTNYSFVRNSQAKPAILGMGFGMGVKKFYKLNRHTFRNESEPKRILELIRKLFPKTFVDYHEKIKALADRQTYLISRYGYIRRFYDVYDWRMLPSYRQPTPKMGEKLIRNNKGQWWLRKDGQDANNAIAYLPSNDAFGKKKEAMRDLWEHTNGNMIKRFGLINEIHDELFFEVDKELINEAILILQSVMESPARYLKNSTAPDGLITKISMKLGPNWAEMEEIKL